MGNLACRCPREPVPDLSPTGMHTFDCNGDDYYNVVPAANTYLSSHCDVADSSWLTPVGVSGK